MEKKCIGFPVDAKLFSTNLTLLASTDAAFRSGTGKLAYKTNVFKTAIICLVELRRNNDASSLIVLVQSKINCEWAYV